MRKTMLRVLIGLGALGCCAAVVALAEHTSKSTAGGAQAAPAQSDGTTSGSVDPVFGLGIPDGYRDWRLVSVSREKGNLNDIRAVLGNDVAIKAFRDGTPVFPDGAMLARIAWTYVSSPDNDKVLGKPQSFIAGSPVGLPDWYLEFMVKDSKKYAATGGWGFAQFDKDGKPADAKLMNTCAPCHQTGNEVAHAHDFVFAHYTP
jgi:hypothetical protein